MNDDHFSFLRKVPIFADLPDADLEQICRDVEVLRLPAGHLLFREGETGTHAFVIKEGLIEIFKTNAGQKVQLAIREPGEVIGEISLLESTPRNASGEALTESEVLAIAADQMDRLLNTNPAAARTMLHTVILRLQSTEASLRQSEKMAQLGTFTAGIAHEMNNPSAAVMRGSAQLRIAIDRSQSLAYELRSRLASEGRSDTFEVLRQQVTERLGKEPPFLDAAVRMDQETGLEEWMEGMGIEDGWELAPQLVELGYDVDALETVVGMYPPQNRSALVRWIAAETETQRLLAEIHQGAGRISEIVKALKSYVYLDQAPTQEIDIHEGLENTLVILRFKLRNGVEVVREYDRSLAPVLAFGSELNQVWTNLIDNAIDAMNGTGRIILRTRREAARLVVEIEDNGPGIPPEVQKKLFYPFFTTKPVGKGMGLGLNISHKIVQKHGGTIEVFSQPGGTRFEVRLPAGKG